MLVPILLEWTKNVRWYVLSGPISGSVRYVGECYGNVEPHLVVPPGVSTHAAWVEGAGCRGAWGDEIRHLTRPTFLS